MILLIDNYDSFTYNLAQILGHLGQQLLVRRNDQITLDEIAALRPERIVISPGPCTPREAGISVASGILEDEARPLNEFFAKYIRYHTPLVTLKTAMTLDGKIAPPPTVPHVPGIGGSSGGLKLTMTPGAGKRKSRPAETWAQAKGKGPNELTKKANNMT